MERYVRCRLWKVFTFFVGIGETRQVLNRSVEGYLGLRFFFMEFIFWCLVRYLKIKLISKLMIENEKFKRDGGIMRVILFSSDSQGFVSSCYGVYCFKSDRYRGVRGLVFQGGRCFGEERMYYRIQKGLGYWVIVGKKLGGRR